MSTTSLSRWASQAPHTRWPLIALGLFALWALAGAVAPPLELIP